MTDDASARCHAARQQIDDYLDNDLSAAQREGFMAHVQACPACAREFQYACRLQDAILDLPRVDCEDRVLEPARTLAAGGNGAAGPPSWTRLLAGAFGAPALLRYALPAVAALLAGAALTTALLRRDDGPRVALEPAAAPAAMPRAARYGPEDVSAEDIARALEELNLAIDYLDQVSQRTEAMIGDRFLLAPLQESLNASFERVRTRRRAPADNGPI